MLSRQLGEFAFDDNISGFHVCLSYANFKGAHGQRSSDASVAVEAKRQSGISKAYVYDIKIALEDEAEPVLFSKRFSELYEFYNCFRQEFPFILVPAFPRKDKSMLYGGKQDKVKQRSEELQRFFAKLLTNTLVLNTNIFDMIKASTVKGLGFSKIWSGMKEKLMHFFEKQRLSAKKGLDPLRGMDCLPEQVELLQGAHR